MTQDDATRPCRILIADDHAPTREDIRRALELDAGFVICAEVADAVAAVQAAVRERPDVCLLDLRMPGSGVAAAWEISARVPETKVVMLTVSEEDADLFAALHARAAGYLSKSMNFDRLSHAVRGALEGEAPMQRKLVSRVLERFYDSSPHRRQLSGLEELGERLTAREWQVLDLVAQDSSTAEIARRLVLSKSAVRSHIAAIVRKLHVDERTAAASLFRRRGA